MNLADAVRVRQAMFGSARVSPLVRGSVAAVLMFGLLGTVAALWTNSFFMRMAPTSGFEVGLLLVQSILVGAYVGIERTACSTKTAGFGGVLGFLGIACPVCNKILMALFGAGALLTYFEPIRLYVALAGIGLSALAVWIKLQSSASGPVARAPGVATGS